MEMVRMGFIGLMICLPFMWVTTFQNQKVEYQDRLIQRLEHGIEEASMDAAFAMKTYSDYTYDGENYYEIHIDREDTLEAFFDNIKARNEGILCEDFPLLIFIEYDGIVAYITDENKYTAKTYYTENTQDGWNYYDLSEKGRHVVIENDSVSITEFNAERIQRDKVIMITLENVLKNISKDSWSLPEFEGSMQRKITNDMSVLAFYQNNTSYGLGRVSLYRVIPSGIMKNEIDY